MIGNDVVDLVLARKESNWKRKGYLDKLFTASEQDLIQNATNQDEVVWLLWSIKESVYKAYQRIHYQQGFYPIKIAVLSLNLQDGKFRSVIELFGNIFYGESQIVDQIIFTIAVQNKGDLDKILYFDQLAYIKNENGLPISADYKKPISVSHHGRAKKIVGIKQNHF
ncbi:4'-phosphopantetheinyl transferase family protein [Flavobacterium algicola]|uniref:4'-phosphopantetheinyl transferase family protein n=1 Tax=Flavobacterium algicola TaxID=556529 RepID=UPI001EFDD877|nr:4'-phosphopantetheinyl transferase superfamily protein [Flavobacterium algicola]MCG9793291.1 4'-phosphopantetheinyl transferase superfamily protein [Flavobacterium algicola]